MRRLHCYLTLAALLSGLGTLAHADQALAGAKNCLSCHSMDKKVVGPGYKEVAAKYRGDKAAAARLANKIMAGGGGVWGTAVMPSNPQVNEAEAKKLAAWILSQ